MVNILLNTEEVTLMSVVKLKRLTHLDERSTNISDDIIHSSDIRSAYFDIVEPLI